MHHSHFNHRLDQDIFIIDQHAADEKFNFERLQASLTLNKQPLICPRPLNLSVLDEMVVRYGAAGSVYLLFNFLLFRPHKKWSSGLELSDLLPNLRFSFSCLGYWVGPVWVIGLDKTWPSGVTPVALLTSYPAF